MNGILTSRSLRLVLLGLTLSCVGGAFLDTEAADRATAPTVAADRATAPTVAILGSPSGGDAWMADVKSKLAGTFMFAQIDIFRIDQTTPTLARALQFQQIYNLLHYPASQ